MLRYRTNVTPAALVDSAVTLHVGLPKTATTLLQERLFPFHKQITYLGKSEPLHKFCTPGVTRLVTQTLRKGVFQCDHAACRRLYDRDVRPLQGRGKVVLLSLEDGSHGSPQRRRAKMDNLRAVWGACRLLITLRHPVEFAESIYLQRLKKINLAPPRRFQLPWSPTLDQWLEQCAIRGEGAELSHLDYADFIADWQMIFGSESVGILVFEELRSDPAAYLDRLCDLLGIERIVADDVLADGPVNPRLKASHVDRLGEIQRSFWSRQRFRLASTAQRVKMLGEPTGPDARVALSPKWRSRVEMQTRDGNRRLASRWNLPLAEYDYPL